MILAVNQEHLMIKKGCGDQGREDAGEFARQFDVRPHHIAMWKSQLLEGAASCSGKRRRTPGKRPWI